jgi:regulatory protein
MAKKNAAPKDLMSTALRLISYRPRSIAELREKLLARGFEAVEVEKAVEGLTGAGYLDDEKFAALLAGSRTRNKFWGPAKIAFELNRKGVSREIVRKTVVRDQGVEEATALEALTRWLKKTGSPALLDRKGCAKAYRFLKGRGFTADSIFKVINRFAGGVEPGPEEP